MSRGPDRWARAGRPDYQGLGGQITKGGSLPITGPAPNGVVSTNGDDSDDGSSGDDGPNNRMFHANRSSCKGYRDRNSGSLRSDRIGHTSPDCRLRAAPRPEWQPRIARRQQGLSVSSLMNLLNVGFNFNR